MPPVSFPFSVRLDSESYEARRLDGSRQTTTTYVPQVRGQQSSVQLDPLNVTDWGDGRGWGQNQDTSEGMILPGPLVTSVALPSVPGGDLEQFAEQDGHIYVVGGRYAYKIANGSSAPTQDQDLGASFVAVSIVPFKTSLFVGGRTSGNEWELPSGGAWTNTMVGAAVQRGKMATVFWDTGTPSLTLVGEQGANAISYVAANPRQATDWTPQPTPLTISNNFAIRSIVASRDHVYFGTTGGLLDLDSSSNAPNLTPEIEHLVMDTNGKATLAANGWVYINAGYGLKRVRSVGQEYAQVQEVGWANQLPPQCPMSGYVTALARHGYWLWAAVYDGTNTWVCKAREAVQGLDRVGPLVWFVAPIHLSGVKVTSLHISGLVDQNPRLWMGCVSGSTRSLKWAPLPLDSAYRDLRQARLYRFGISFQFDEPEEDHGDDALPKFIREFVGEGENLGVGTQDVLSIAADGSPMFTEIGSLRSNPRAVIQPSSATSILASRYILRHTGSGTTTQPPVLKKLSRRVIPRPDLLEVRSYQFIMGPAVRGGDGALDGRSVRRAKRTLSRLQQVLPVSFRDEDGASYSVMVVAGMTLTEVSATTGDSKERRVLAADVQVAVTASYGGSTFTVGDGTVIGDESKVIA